VTSSTASPDASTTPSERPEAAVDARPDQAAPSAAQKLRWGSRPDPKSLFAAVFDGYCAQMQVGPMPGPPIIAWGEHGVSVVRLEGDGVVDLSPRGASFDLWDFRGIFGHSEGTILLGVSYGCCGGYEESYLLWTGSGWQAAPASIKYPSGRFLINEWGGHALHGDYDGTWSSHHVDVDGLGRLQLDGAPSRSAVAVSGELFLFGSAGDNEAERAKAWRFAPRTRVPVSWDVPGKKVREVVVHAADDVYVETDEALLHFDGARWQALSRPSNRLSIVSLAVAPDGALWVMSMWEGNRTGIADLTGYGVLHRRAPDGTYANLTPSGGQIEDVAGVELGTPWAVMKKNWKTPPEIVRYVDGRWENVELPLAPFETPAPVPVGGNDDRRLQVQGVHVRAADDVWVNATYIERGVGWRDVDWERRRVLFRTIHPRETLRCRNGFESWPSVADASCATPVVVLSVTPLQKPADVARARAAFKKWTAPEGSELVEIEAGVSRILGVRTANLDAAKVIAARYGKKIPFSRPEIVCADPEPVRRYADALVSGQEPPGAVK